jgi:ABC-2 type transport system permease protein
MLVDPLPAIDITLSPSEKNGSNVNPFMRNSAPPPKEKGDIQGLLRDFGINWSMSQIVWDQYNPHPDLSHLPSEVVFVGAGNENPDRFNQEAINTAQLQELILLFSGYLQPSGSADYTFTPLVQSGRISGLVPYSQMVQRNFFGGAQLVMRKTLRRPSQSMYTLAAYIEGKNAEGDSTASSSVNLMVVADVDFISQQFFDIRRLGVGGFNFDNVTFFLNSMDVLMDDESFINLRSKRVKYRTLETVEAQTLAYTQQRVQDEDQAEREAQQALEEARSRLTVRVNEVRQRTDLDEQTKQIMVRNLEEVENRRFETLKTNIETEKEAKIQASKENMEQQIRLIQNTIKNLAALMPPIPVFVLGVFIFIRRRQREKDAAVAARRLRN